jgi:hypothetical protein
LSFIGDFVDNLGVKVILEDNSVGVIVRRLNAETYEILLENDELVILSPKEFKEVKK